MVRIAVIGTGGTIAGKAENVLKGSMYKAGVEGVGTLLDGLGLDEAIQTEGIQVAAVGSEDMTEEIWFRLADAVKKAVARNDVDGVVVVHGTDTMEETACFVDLTVSTPKPVIFTGSMRPGNVPGADGPGNLSAAIRAAGSKKTWGRGVLGVFADQIFAARDMVKIDAMVMDAFGAPGFGPLGRVIDGEPVWFRSRRRNGGVSLFPLEELVAMESGGKGLPWVEIVYGHAGQRPDMARAAMEMGVRGIVHAGVGAANIHESVKPLLLQAAEQGIAVVAASRCGVGVTSLKGEGKLIYSRGLNPQKARVLLQAALSRTGDSREIQHIFSAYMYEGEGRE